MAQDQTQQAMMNLPPFSLVATRKFQFIDEKSVSEGKTTYFELPRVGYGCRLWGVFTGKITGLTGGAAAWHQDGIWKLLRQVVFEMNLNAFIQTNLSGFALKQIGSYLRRGFSFNSIAGNIYALKVSGNLADNDVFKIVFPIPFTLNDSYDMDAGGIRFQTEGLLAKLKITLDTVANCTDDASGVLSNSTIKIFSEYLQEPSVPHIPPDLNVIKRYSEVDLIDKKGVFRKKLYPEGHIFNLMHVVRYNELRSDNIGNVGLRYNISEQSWDEHYLINRFRNREHLGVEMDTGVIMHDFLRRTDTVAGGAFIDVVDTQAIGLSESLIEIPDDVVLTAGKDTIETIYQTFVPIQVAIGQGQ